MDELHSARRNDSTVTVGDQDRVLDILELEYLHEILNVRAQTDVRAQQVSALAESGQGRRIDVVASVAEKRGHTGPAPATVASAVEECERGQIVIELSFSVGFRSQRGDDVGQAPPRRRYRSPYALSSCFTSAKAS